MIFVRHPRPDVAQGTCYGRLDLDIHEDGHGQIERALESVPRSRKIFASPALRCRKLAQSLGERDGIEPVFDERLWELHMGDWEGLLWKDIPREHSTEWLSDPMNKSSPGGETFLQLQNRVLDALREVDDNGALIVCHAGPIRATQMAWLGWSLEQALAQVPVFAQPVTVPRPQTSPPPKS